MHGKNNFIKPNGAFLVWFSSPVDVDKHARDFMEAAKKLQLYFISLQREDKPTKAEMLRKVWWLHWNVIQVSQRDCLISSPNPLLYLLSKQEIALMEDELDRKTELIKKQENLIQEWRKELKDQLEKHNVELDRV